MARRLPAAGIPSVGILCLLALFAACASSSDGPLDPAANGATDYVVGCESIIDYTDTLPDSYVELAGALSLPLPAEGLQVGRSEAGFRFSKFGLAVRSDTQATIGVQPIAGEAYLGYGGWRLVSSPSESQFITFAPCAGDGAAWVIHVGGIWTTDNGCVRVDVIAGQLSDVATLGVRAAC